MGASTTIGLLAVATTVSITSCAGQSAIQTYSITNDAFINIGNRVITFRQAGKINDDDYNNVILPLMREGNQLMREYDTAVKAGTPKVDYASLIQSVLSRLEAYLIAKGGSN